MNLFINWGYDVNDISFDKIISELNVKNCYYNAGTRAENKSQGTQYYFVDIDEKLNFYKKNQNTQIPLDAELLEKMSKYESVAMDIIWRWRRSISTDHSYKNIKEIYKIYLRYWNDFFIKNRIDQVILFNVPHVPSLYFVYVMAKIHNIPVVVQQYIAEFNDGYRNRRLVTDIYTSRDNIYIENFNHIEKKYSYNLTKEDLDNRFQVFFDEYSKTNKEINRIVRIEKTPLMSIAKLAYERFRLYVKRQDWRILYKKIVYYSTYVLKSKKLLNYVERKEVMPNLEEDYFFFPLHYQPEATTLPLAEYYVDQLLTINMISSALPDGVSLYVKEHPAYWRISEGQEGMFETRSKDFYDTITELDKVKLIKHDFSSLELIDRCRGVITATGTAAIEAVFKNKPVLLFSDFIYSKLPGVYQIKSNSDCIRAVDIILKGKYDIDEEKILLFFKSIEKYYLRVGIDMENSSMNNVDSAALTAEMLIRYIRSDY